MAGAYTEVRLRNTTYEKLADLSKLLQISIDDIITDMVVDCMDDYFADDVKKAEEDLEYSQSFEGSITYKLKEEALTGKG